MKKSFILYSDQIEIFKKLSPEQTQDLVFKIFEYSETHEPNSIKDPVVDIAFINFKLSLDRDHDKYLKICERNRINGLKGGRPKEPKKPSGFSGNPNNPSKPRKADSDSDND